jgi:hypothetical protein
MALRCNQGTGTQAGEGTRAPPALAPPALGPPALAPPALALLGRENVPARSQHCLRYERGRWRSPPS